MSGIVFGRYYRREGMFEHAGGLVVGGQQRVDLLAQLPSPRRIRGQDTRPDRIVPSGLVRC